MKIGDSRQAIAATHSASSHSNSNSNSTKSGIQTQVIEPNPTEPVRDVFSASFPIQKHLPDSNAAQPIPAFKGHPKETSITKGATPRPIDPASEEIVPIEGTLPKNKAKPISKPDQEFQAPKKPEQVTLRFDGVVDAGSPTAVITYKGTSYTVKVGESLPDGLIVVSIWNDKISIQKGKSLRTILIGKESDF